MRLKRLIPAHFLSLFILALTASPETLHAGLSTRTEVPEFIQLKGWLNTQGRTLTRDAILGKTTLFFFWNAGSAESLRFAGTIQAWFDRYEPYDLVVIGFHTPEFTFEKSEGTVVQVLKRHRLKFPVGLDSSAAMWKAFNVLDRPAVILADSRGRIRQIFYGRTSIPEIEKQLRLLLNEAGKKPDAAPGPRLDIAPSGTRLGFGYSSLTGYGNSERIISERALTYQPPPVFAPERFYLRGSWVFQREFLTPGKPPSEIIITLRAGLTFLTAGSRQTVPVPLEVRLDGGPVPRTMRGGDVVEQSGRTYLFVRAFRPYEILNGKDGTRERTLEIKAEGPVELYRISG